METIDVIIKSKIKKKELLKCGFCRKEGHLITECVDIKMNDILKVFNNEINENIMNNLHVLIILTCFMNDSYNNINHKYLYYSPLKEYIKNKIEKVIKNKTIIEKKVISKINNLPTSLSHHYLINQLAEKYFENFIEIFKNKEYYLDIFYQDNLFDNIDFFIKNIEKYNKNDVALMIFLLTKISDLEVDFIINYFFIKHHEMKISNIYEINNLNKLLIGIHIGIDKLIELGYELENESEYFIKNLIKEETGYLLLNDIDEEYTCPICFEEIDNPKKIITNCNHIFCKSCFEMIKEKRSIPYSIPSCPLCRTNLHSIKLLISF